MSHNVQPAEVRGPEPTADDAWLDELERTPTRRTFGMVVRDYATGPARLVRRSASFLATTPGKLIAMMIVLTLALLAAGLAMSNSMAKRQDSLDTLVTATEPMSNSAHLLFTSLSQADTVATTGFVQPGMLTEEEMQLYQASLDRAVTASNDVYRGSVEAERAEDSEEILELVTSIQRHIPVYSALMERALVNQRMGNPVGVAYMSEASGIMREQMLDDADRLYTLTQRQVAREMARLSAPQFVPLSGLLAALFFLLVAQWWLWRTFRRRLNRGFLVATASMLVAVLWVSVSNLQLWQSGFVGFARAAEPWEQLTSARIDAQEARTDETFALLRRQSVAQSSRSFDTTHQKIEDALDAAAVALADRTARGVATGLEGTAGGAGGAGAAGAGAGPVDTETLITSARVSLDEWSENHAALLAAIDNGQYQEAVVLLTGQDPGEGGADAEGADAHAVDDNSLAGRVGATAYRKLDADLQQLIAISRGSTREYITASLDATRLVSGAVALLSLLAVLCIWIGIRHRIGEYM